SRVGLRAILVPLFVTITIAFVLRALRTQKRWLYVAGGLFLGLSLYTYQAARILPPLILMAFLYFVLSKRTFAAPLLLNMSLTFGMALLVFMPMVVYEWQYPGSLNQRVNDAALIDLERPLAEQLPALIEQSWAALRVFSFEGDLDPLFTIPGRPSLNIFLSLLFYQGLFIAVTRLYLRRDVFLLTWLGAMLVPAMIAGQAGAAKRAIGALPAVMILIALGVLIPWKWFRQLRAIDPTPTTRRAYALFGVIIIGGFLYTGLNTYRDYFLIWANDPSLVTHFQLKRAAVGQYIATLPQTEQILVSPLQPSHPTIRLHSNLREGVRGYNGRSCLLMPDRRTAATTYVISPDIHENSLALLKRHFPSGEVVAEAPSSVNSDLPDYVAYRVPLGATLNNRPKSVANVSWENQIKLVGYELQETTLQPDTELVLNLYYEAAAEMMVSYTVFVHLVPQDDPNPTPTVWAQHDSEPCEGVVPTNSWQEGDLLRDTVRLQLPADLPDGQYQLLLGFYRWPELTRLSLTDSRGRALDKTVYELTAVSVIDL
ncbi:MAG: hypothetical protein KDE51_08805, partial [Anaerolineales bacterium]|nr:hypothetical protein [Anaerolineales bacterium]